MLIPEGHRDNSEETEVQSFVVPVTNGIQLETRRHNRRLPADDSAAAGDVSYCFLACKHTNAVLSLVFLS